MPLTGANIWLSRQPSAQPPRLRLFCLPYAGGGANLFRGYSAALPDQVEVCAVQLPGRERRFREPALSSVDEIVENFADALRDQLDLPYAILGHSLGALVGFELARRMRDSTGRPPAHLFASGHRAPQLPDSDPPIHDLPDEEFIDAIRNYDGTPEAVFESPELLTLILPTLRADITAAETYVYHDEAPLDCPITALGGVADELVDLSYLEPWGEQTRRTFQLHMLQGGHFFIDQSRSEFLKLLRKELDTILGGLEVG